jgi:hypothetical protein
VYKRQTTLSGTANLNHAVSHLFKNPLAEL